MALIRFTANHQDLSTDRGYQFKFLCDKCGNGYMSRFQPSLTGTAGGLFARPEISSVESFRAQATALTRFNAQSGAKRTTARSRKRSRKLRFISSNALAAANGFARMCAGTRRPGLCEGCAPDFEEDFAANKAQAMSQAAQNQLYEKARQTDYASATDMSAGASCPERDARVPLVWSEDHRQQILSGVRRTACKSNSLVRDADFEPEGAPKFCPECGVKMPLR